MTADGKNKILLGIGGGIAAYKALEVAGRLKKAGHDVYAVMTGAAAKFVTPLCFESVTLNPVTVSVFPGKNSGLKHETFPHLFPASGADVFAVMPATADLIARISCGIADDAVCASALALPEGCHKFFCPAMNVNMWGNVAVQANVTKMRDRGWTQIGPESGLQACGAYGPGRMSEPENIADKILSSLGEESALRGRHVLIFSGPTHEYLDPVRFIANASTGKMGRALAERALKLGARVTMITGPVPSANLPEGQGIKIEKIVSAGEMLKQGRIYYKKADIIIFAAAVADYRPAKSSDSKIARTSSGIDLRLIPNQDIAALLNASKNRGQISVGFALETGDGESRALKKLKDKNFDAILLNSVSSIGADRSEFSLLKKGSGVFENLGLITKESCACKIFEEILKKTKAQK